MKSCTNISCNQINPQPLANFYKEKRNTDGLFGQCKACKNMYAKIYRKMHPIETRKSTHSSWIRTFYNLTPEQYNQVLNRQNGVCTICGSLPPSNGFLSVDHCHLTQQLRGLLCKLCNLGIGKFRDNIQFLAKAVDYIQRDVEDFDSIVRSIPHERQLVFNKKTHYRQKHLKENFGINIEGYQWMCTYFKNRCTICSIDHNRTKESWCVDHDSKTGQIRGLLCDNCNTGLGCSRDNPTELKKAMKYLKNIQVKILVN